MKESMRTLIPQFSMHRMVKEYTERLYYPQNSGDTQWLEEIRR